jgi:hypothetical protein
MNEKIPKMYKLLEQNRFCPLPGEITNRLPYLLPLQTNVFLFSLSVFFLLAGQGRAGQGEKIMTFCGLTVGNLSFCKPKKKLLEGMVR